MALVVLLITWKRVLHWRMLCPKKRCWRMDVAAARKLGKESKKKKDSYSSQYCYLISFRKIELSKGEFFSMLSRIHFIKPMQWWRPLHLKPNLCSDTFFELWQIAGLRKTFKETYLHCSGHANRRDEKNLQLYNGLCILQRWGKTVLFLGRNTVR